LPGHETKKTMKIYNHLQKIKKHLKQNKKLWLEHEYNENGKIYKKEFFIIFHNNAFHVGLDEYLEDYEDATDLYRVHIRKSYSSLPEAMTFITSELRITEDEILFKCNKS
jgi:hypothetical protein